MDLDSIIAEYRSFKARCTPMLEEWEEAQAKVKAAEEEKAAKEKPPAPAPPAEPPPPKAA